MRQQLKFRDLQVAEDVGKKAKLGWVDVEFAIAGCAYLDPETNKLCYMVSSNEEDIYRFVEKSARSNIYPGKILHMQKRFPVPSGMKDAVCEDLMRDLARELKQQYPKEFFRELYQIADYITTDHAAMYLWDMAEEIEGLFDEERLLQFEEMTNYFFGRRLLLPSTYKGLCKWLSDERKNMQDDYMNSRLHKTQLYGAIYELGGKQYSLVDVKRENIYRNLLGKEEAGAFIGPMYAKTFWYNQTTPVATSRTAFKKQLQQMGAEGVQVNIKSYFHHITIEEQQEYQQFLQRCRDIYGESTALTALRYGYHWGLL